MLVRFELGEASKSDWIRSNKWRKRHSHGFERRWTNIKMQKITRPDRRVGMTGDFEETYVLLKGGHIQEDGMEMARKAMKEWPQRTYKAPL